MSVSIVLRAVKGVPLTNDEVDTNFTNLKVGIEEYTASDVLIKLKTVDGAGSGLDSDLLDGLNAVSVDLVGNSIVSRTAGAFSAGVITATSFIGPVTGNITGNVTGNVTGSAGTVAYGGLTGTPTIWNQNTTGLAAGILGTLAVAQGGTGGANPTDARLNLQAASRGANSDITSLTGILIPLTVAQGGSGASTLTANSVLTGNGTGAFQSVAPGSSGNLLTSNGSAWVSSGNPPPFASGTRISFQQTTAPTGWTKDTTAAINDSILRVVTGSVASGGSVAFSTWNGQTATGAHTLTTAQMPSHIHTGGSGNTTPYFISRGYSHDGSIDGSRTVNPDDHDLLPATNYSAGGDGSHTHPLTQNIKYYDFIIASKD